MQKGILEKYGFSTVETEISAFGSGLINHTWKVITKNGAFILQRINTNIFKNPEYIDQNLDLLKQYLNQNTPDYLFVAPLPTLIGATYVLEKGGFYRLMPFVDGSYSVDFISNPGQAYQAAKQFGKFSALLKGFELSQLKDTLPDFHNLLLRSDQFLSALTNGNQQRVEEAVSEIHKIQQHKDIETQYRSILANKEIPLRVVHHDTKISNVLFNDNDEGLCVIDLDTVMPGYIFSDVGDMMRTYLSETTEEEIDTTKIKVRPEVLRAIYDGYMEEMGSVLTSEEKELFYYSGKFMIYMQALRFLTDYLNDDCYYHTTYPQHNLNRARNQLVLLERYLEALHPAIV